MNSDFEKFANEIRDRIFENSSDRDNLDISIQHVQKVNQQDLVSLTVKPKGSNIAPSLYLNAAFEAYKEGQSMENILHSLENTITSHSIMDKVNVDFVSLYETSKEQIFPKLINKDMNKEFLEKVPHYDYGDLAVVFYVKMEHPQIGEGSITVNNQIFEKWGVEDKVIMDAALENLKNNTQCKDLFGFIKEIDPVMALTLDDEIPVDKSPIVLSTDDQRFGAAALLNEDIMKALSDRFGGDVVIIPSSIHELLILNDENTPRQELELNSMVHEVNATTVAQEDLLSEHVYHFNGEDLMYRELPKYASIDDIKETPFTNMDLVSAQTGEVYHQGKEADKAQEKQNITNIDDKKAVPKRDDMAI